MIGCNNFGGVEQVFFCGVAFFAVQITGRCEGRGWDNF